MLKITHKILDPYIILAIINRRELIDIERNLC